MKQLFTLLFLFSFHGIFAQKQVEHLIHSKIFGDERKVTVYLPKEYLLDSLAKFPVAYCEDIE